MPRNYNEVLSYKVSCLESSPRFCSYFKRWQQEMLFSRDQRQLNPSDWDRKREQIDRHLAFRSHIIRLISVDERVSKIKSNENRNE